MLLTKKRYNKIKKSKNQSRKLPKRRKKQKKFRRSFRKRHLDLKRKTLKNRKKRVMKGGSLSRWTEKHPQQYAEAITKGITQRELQTAYENITKNMRAEEKVSYSSNLLNQDRRSGKKLIDGSNIPESFNKKVLRMIREKRKQETNKEAAAEQGVKLQPKRRARASTTSQGASKEPLLMAKALTQAQRRKIQQQKQRKNKSRRRRKPSKRQTKKKSQQPSQPPSSPTASKKSQPPPTARVIQQPPSTPTASKKSQPPLTARVIQQPPSTPTASKNSQSSSRQKKKSSRNKRKQSVARQGKYSYELTKIGSKNKPSNMFTNEQIVKLYKKSGLIRKLGFMPSLPMGYTGDINKKNKSIPFAYVAKDFITRTDPGPGTWMPGENGFPYVADRYRTIRQSKSTRSNAGKRQSSSLLSNDPNNPRNILRQILPRDKQRILNTIIKIRQKIKAAVATYQPNEPQLVRQYKNLMIKLAEARSQTEMADSKQKINKVEKDISKLQKEYRELVGKMRDRRPIGKMRDRGPQYVPNAIVSRSSNRPQPPANVPPALASKTENNVLETKRNSKITGRTVVSRNTSRNTSEKTSRRRKSVSFSNKLENRTGNSRTPEEREIAKQQIQELRRKRRQIRDYREQARRNEARRAQVGNIRSKLPEVDPGNFTNIPPPPPPVVDPSKIPTPTPSPTSSASARFSPPPMNRNNRAVAGASKRTPSRDLAVKNNGNIDPGLAALRRFERGPRSTPSDRRRVAGKTNRPRGAEPGKTFNLGGDKWVNIRTDITANPPQVIVTGKIGDNAADTLATIGQ